MFLKAENIIDIRATEGVDALRVITDDTETLLFLRQLKGDHLLHPVGVLVLIDEDIPEMKGVFLSDILVVLEEKIGVDEEVVEIHRVGLAAALTVKAVDPPHLGDLLPLVLHALVTVAEMEIRLWTVAGLYFLSSRPSSLMMAFNNERLSASS